MKAKQKLERMRILCELYQSLGEWQKMLDEGEKPRGFVIPEEKMRQSVEELSVLVVLYKKHVLYEIL